MHILALANVLKRPILLLNSWDRMLARCSPDLNAGSGMFLPLRHTRDDILQCHGNMPGPLVIGWQSKDPNHYVPLVPEFTNSTMEGIVASYEKAFADGTEAGRIWDLFLKRHMTFINENMFNYPPNIRDRAFAMLKTLLDNVSKYLDNNTYGGPGGRVVDIEKYRTINPANATYRNSIVAIPFTETILGYFGFVLDPTDVKLHFTTVQENCLVKRNQGNVQ